MATGLKIIGCRQIRGEGLDRRQRKNRRPILLVKPAWMGFTRLQPRGPVGLCQTEVHGGEIAIGDADDRPRRCPGSFGSERQFFGIDCCDEVFALFATDAGGM